MPPIQLKPDYRIVTESGYILIYHGDCLNILPRLPAESVDLIFADPPFNIGYKYDQYKDSLEKDKYLEWTHNWVDACKRILKSTGSIYIAIGAKYQAEVKLILEEVGFYWRDTIIWYYTFGPRQTTKFTPSWIAIHYFTKDKNKWTWNLESVKIPSLRQLKYKDKRAVKGGKLPDNVWILDPNSYKNQGFLFGSDAATENCWLESRVCGTYKERVDFPCQMPLSILERIISVSSNKRDVILDPFLGSGTTAVAAKKLDRSCVGVELSKEYIDNCVIFRLNN